ncbi:DUF6296 family protein [Streptomyces sp. NBC_00503]|uniref:DUF6296 family protein n=1 Tax=Streptomyces sp. NBC_00503 TaxID=2903659 RepID=UPI003FCCCE79
MPRRYELVFPGGLEGGQDTVEVTVTGRTGPGGHPIYEDATGIVQAEISDRSEVRVLAGTLADPLRADTASSGFRRVPWCPGRAGLRGRRRCWMGPKRARSRWR